MDRTQAKQRSEARGKAAGGSILRVGLRDGHFRKSTLDAFELSWPGSMEHDGIWVLLLPKQLANPWSVVVFGPSD